VFLYAFDLIEHDGVQGPAANPVEPRPKKPVRAEKPCTTGALAVQDGHLMSKGDELKFEAGAATNTEAEQRHEGGKNRDHARWYGGGAKIL